MWSGDNLQNASLSIAALHALHRSLNRKQHDPLTNWTAAHTTSRRLYADVTLIEAEWHAQRHEPI